MTDADDFLDLFGELGVRADGTPKPLAVETYEGRGMSGERYAASVDLAGTPRVGGRRIVRASTGDERLSTLTLYVTPEHGAKFVELSRVTVDGRTSTVLERTFHDTAGLTAFYEIKCE